MKEIYNKLFEKAVSGISDDELLQAIIGGKKLNKKHMANSVFLRVGAAAALALSLFVTAAVVAVNRNMPYLSDNNKHSTEENNSGENGEISSTEAPNLVVISVDTKPPVTEQPTESVNIAQLDFKVNKITNQISGAPPYYSPEMYDQKIWSHQEMTDYYGVDINDIHGEVFGDDDYTTQYCDEYGYITDKNGNIAKDTVSSSYIASDNSIVTIYASRVSLPYDCCYELESNETNNINGIDVLIGGISLSGNSDMNDFFYADFHKNGINYRFEACVSAEKFYAIIKNYIAL